jgi:hypothetical protein
MEHIIVTELGNNMVRLVAEKGYRLKDKRTDMYHSEAVVRRENMRFFVAE